MNDKYKQEELDLFEEEEEEVSEDLEYEDLSLEESRETSDKLFEEANKIRESIVYIDPTPEVEKNYIELRSPDDGDESMLKRKIKEMVNNGNFERKDFIDYLEGDNEQARKMINTYPKKKDFKMEEFIMWVNFLGYDIRLIKDLDPYEIGELVLTERDNSLVQFENDSKFINIKQMLVGLINKSGLKISNVKFFFSDKPTNAYNIIERFKKNASMTTDTFSLWLTLIGYTIQFVERDK